MEELLRAQVVQKELIRTTFLCSPGGGPGADPSQRGDAGACPDHHEAGGGARQGARPQQLLQAIRRRQGTHGQPTGNTRYILDLNTLMVSS